MWHNPSFTLEIDCRCTEPPKPGQTFLLNVVREERFEVIHVAGYIKPQRLLTPTPLQEQVFLAPLHHQRP